MQYQWKQGKIIGNRSSDPGNLFKVRVLPDMIDIEESDLLPYYANFFQGDSIAYQDEDVVWLLVNEDFTVGFILGLAQPTSGESITQFIEVINKAEIEAGTDKSSYQDLSVVRVAGSCITFHNTKNGQSGAIYNNKTVWLFGADGSIWVKNPGMTINVSKNGEAQITGKLWKETLKEINSTSEDSKETTGNKSINTSGDMSVLVGKSYNTAVTGNYAESAIGSKTEVVGTSHSITAGVSSSRTVAVGAITDTVLAGGYLLNVAAGGISIFASAPILISSLSVVSINAPLINLFTILLKAPWGLVIPTYGGPFSCLPVCAMFPLIPHAGNTLIGTGV